jgi:hypothetical protein
MIGVVLAGIFSFLPMLADTQWVTAKLDLDGRIVLKEHFYPPGHRGICYYSGPPLCSKAFEMKRVSVYRMDGTRVDPKELPSLLGREVVVMASVQVFPAMHWRLKESESDTLIFVIPEPVGLRIGF